MCGGFLCKRVFGDRVTLQTLVYTKAIHTYIRIHRPEAQNKSHQQQLHNNLTQSNQSLTWPA